MQVTYKDHMGTDLTVVNAARVSFHKEHKEFQANDKGLVNYLASHNHWTPFAHCCLSVVVKAPIFVRGQLAKHTVGLVMNEVSRRYVDDEPEFWYPEYWRKRADNKKQGSLDEPVDTNKALLELYEDNCMWMLDTYNHLISSEVAPEQARAVLPQAMYTEWWWTGSLAAFARVCNLRLDPHAQKETAEIAQKISDISIKLWPISWPVLVKYSVKDEQTI